MYMGPFYFFTYGLLVAVAAYAFAFSMNPGRISKYLHYHDNLIVKAGCWPFVIMSMTAITWAQ